ncbi:hypothetical protein Hypma_004928 [Hypsizygus marmoreus]|uniref:Uncharacterized protein n=1 Tax=Hypsizygus marmoreus TaxID=39966 RepID=A0A369KBV6_HYPMA|nr:hypothetical protein Hypma_004928 [Hypsizygus marmoreus]
MLHSKGRKIVVGGEDGGPDLGLEDFLMLSNPAHRSRREEVKERRGWTPAKLADSVLSKRKVQSPSFKWSSPGFNTAQHKKPDLFRGYQGS